MAARAARGLAGSRSSHHSRNGSARRFTPHVPPATLKKGFLTASGPKNLESTALSLFGASLLLPRADHLYPAVGEVPDIARCESSPPRMSNGGNLSIELANRASQFPPSGGNRSECSRCCAIEWQNSLYEIFLEYGCHRLLQPNASTTPRPKFLSENAESALFN
jgi:hypothetical protein